MDWNTIRVLAKNLQELLDEIPKGTHIIKGDNSGDDPWRHTGDSVRDSWRLGIISIPQKLLAELGHPETEDYIHPSHLAFSWPSSGNNFATNPYLRRAISTSQFANQLINEANASTSLLNKNSVDNKKSKQFDCTKVFIVHGRDELVKAVTARFVEKLGFSAIILHEQANSGKTIIEKIEEYTNVGFAIVLYTPCDIGGLANESPQKPRARQNVVFEHGYLIGKLGRQNVCALVKNDVEIPNDISGIVYIPLDSDSAWQLKIVKELENAGYPVDRNKL